METTYGTGSMCSTSWMRTPVRAVWHAALEGHSLPETRRVEVAFYNSCKIRRWPSDGVVSSGARVRRAAVGYIHGGR